MAKHEVPENESKKKGMNAQRVLWIIYLALIALIILAACFF